MIWHIFKKDLELMWRPILAVASIQLAFVVIQLRLESVNDSAVLQSSIKTRSPVRSRTG